jgi:hypothetical protein
VELLFRPWIKNIALANTPYNFCCVRVTPLHSFTFPLHFCSIFEFNFVTPEAEKFNGWMAMIGFIAAFGAYATTGQIIPGIF